MRNTRTLINIEDAREVGTLVTEPMPAQFIAIPPSGLTPMETYGIKCFHGVYIPANSPDPNLAPYCSLCYPYKILVREDSEYQA